MRNLIMGKLLHSDMQYCAELLTGPPAVSPVVFSRKDLKRWFLDRDGRGMRVHSSLRNVIQHD